MQIYDNSKMYIFRYGKTCANNSSYVHEMYNWNTSLRKNFYKIVCPRHYAMRDFNFLWVESIIIFAQWKQAAEC